MIKDLSKRYYMLTVALISIYVLICLQKYLANKLFKQLLVRDFVMFLLNCK